MPPKQIGQKNSDIINFYDHADIKKHLSVSTNPHFDETQISLPARIGIIGNSGSRKSSTLLNFISKTNCTWGHIYVVAKTCDEPLYLFLAEKVKSKNITFITKLADVPSPKELKKYGDNTLIVFDDMCNESLKAQEVIGEYFIFGRKLNITSVYISQSYFKIPKVVRLQFSILMLLKLSSMRDLNMVCSDFNTGLSKTEMGKIYKSATQEAGNFLKIDVNTADNDKRYSHNFTNFFILEDDE